MAVRVGRKDEPNAQYIGRGSPLGNPFVMQNKSSAERKRVCTLYKDWLAHHFAQRTPTVMQELKRLADLHNKTGELVLGCYCTPKQCHGDTIKKYLEIDFNCNEEISMTSKQPEGFIEVTDILEKALFMARQHKSCFSCENCNVNENICNKFGSTPPMKVIQVGCQHYVPDIPF